MTPSQHAKVMEALESAFDQTCSVGRPKDWETIREALSIMRAVQVGEPSVRIPTSENEAALMTLIGMEWLNKHAPHRLVGTSTVPTEPSEVKP